MTDLVSQLVGALEAATTELESHQGNPYCNLYDLPEFKAAIAQARAALTAAKAGGWVAVPGAVYEDDGVSLIRRGTEDERCCTRGSVRLYAHLPTPPKEQSAWGLGLVDAVADPRSATE